MCGIAGIFNYADRDRPVDRALLERMTQALAHRGPDGVGYHVDGPLGFGHRRLSIVDLSPTGQQPMPSADGRFWITYNGELYNHRDFRRALDGQCRFRGSSDTETLVNLFAARGTAALPELIGIFGFAIWDSGDRRLTLVRDMLGVKQVYFHDDGRRVLFASEVKALLEAESVSRAIDPEGINQYLHFHTPLFERTLFREIKQLAPAELIEFRHGQGPRRQKYWQVDDFHIGAGSAAENTDELRALLQQVVSDQLMSDVPVGAFFSGGIDSSAIAAYAAKTGAAPTCFGVHFTAQGVIDERPFQESTAKALGLELELTTVDGRTFPEDMGRLLASQDGPVIGPAMIPMDAVSRLAARRVKVCMGGQAADETFGGYARYALCEPLSALRHWAVPPGRQAALAGEVHAPGGNLRKQFFELETLGRLARTALNAHDWRARYFFNFAKTSEKAWLEVLDRELVSRQSCWRLFVDETERSSAGAPAATAMHWDMRTYLPGLFTQDDRMSMAHSLESRVPFADPRLVKFAFRIPFWQKFRLGSSKWLLREVVADALPPEVLNRRKVGFDTPAVRWMSQLHRDFVRDTLLSSAARQRGWLQTHGVEELLASGPSSAWFDRTWKILCLELWAQKVIDQRVLAKDDSQPIVLQSAPANGSGQRPSGPRAPHASRRPLTAFKYAAREVKEMRPGTLLSRLRWELTTRSGAVELVDVLAPRPPASPAPIDLNVLPFDSHADAAARCHRTTTSAAQRTELLHLADQAARGRIQCFGKTLLDFGDPIDWHLNPVTGRHWRRNVHWSRAHLDEPDVGDVKMTWEAARFPQAFLLARAAIFAPDRRTTYVTSLLAQIDGFLAANPYPLGVHWLSGQEIAIRLCAWFFALSALRDVPGASEVAGRLTDHLALSAMHIERHITYSRDSVYNNHLLYEALALELAGRLMPKHPSAGRWRAVGLSLLEQEAGTQFYGDGSYIQESHNYQRTSVHCYLMWAAIARRGGGPLPAAILSAMERALDFLHAHLNPVDGKLPNYGTNDGSHPLLLSTCDFTDFRPVIQATSVLVTGRRCLEPGPWDEMASWLFGPAALDAPVEHRPFRTKSFAGSGYHVLRDETRGCTFLTFRCGDVRERFSQIDMLSVDVFWRGHNVVVDAGSYRYNAADLWHEHFLGTESHNTVTIDGENQMVHYRRFKNLYWTKARRLALQSGDDWWACAGEHLGYTRAPIECTHRRSVLMAAGEIFVVLDQIEGRGRHDLAVHFLAGDFPHCSTRSGAFAATTPSGPFVLAIYDVRGNMLPLDVVRGQRTPPRGWLSRFYAHKVAVPSIKVEKNTALPATVVTVMCGGGEPQVVADESSWTVVGPTARLSFSIRDGLFADVTASRLGRNHPRAETDAHVL